jgi:FKBP-type peptidyl-prolyl cis-trans isomerase
MKAWDMRMSGWIGATLVCLLAVGTIACSKGADDHETGASSAVEEAAEEQVAEATIVELPSGLKYEIIESGTGASPGLTDKVTVHYRGTLTDGTEFDSSYKRGQPAQFPVNRVIAGWTEALQLMSVGSKWRLFIPPALAYGARGTGPIPANATLVFDVELLQIN